MKKGTLKDKMTSAEFRNYLEKKDQAKDSKFGAIPTETADGQIFQSTLEATYYNRMWVLQKAGEVQTIERQVRYEFIVNGVLVGTYLLDFRVTYTNGTIEHVDCKSQPTKTALYMIKKALMMALYKIEIKEVYN